jgi:hypothetical protein
MKEKDRPFPRYAADYFNQLLQQYLLLVQVTPGRTIPPSIAELIAKAAAQPNEMTWADVFTLETAFLYALPKERLADELQLARDRYRDIVGADEYATYDRSVPTSVSLLTRTEDELRSELMTLAERIRYLYTFVPPKESVRNKISMRTGWWTLTAALLGIAVYVLTRMTLHSAVITILVVMFVGQMGGFLSVQQRLQAAGGVDPLFKELQLTNGWFSVVVIAPISGALFAIVLYFMFVGGLLTGGLFPRFGPSPAPSAPPLAARTPAPARLAAAPPPTTSTREPRPSPTPCPDDAYCSPLDVTQFLERAQPTALEDWGKLLVWAFIAGFAERFVPDALTRLTGQASPTGPPTKPSTTNPPEKPLGREPETREERPPVNDPPAGPDPHGPDQPPPAPEPPPPVV